MNEAWFLVGMMGVGKSAVGRSLAQLSHRSFYDLDWQLQRQFGSTINEVFATRGETCFRHAETELLQKTDFTEMVVSTGGGVIKAPENWLAMRKWGRVVYLRANVATLQARLERGRLRRPLLSGDDWVEKLNSLLAEREPLYMQADIAVDVDGGDVGEVASRVLAALKR